MVFLFQKMRCTMMIQPNDQRFSAEVLICYMCSMRPKALSPLPFLTRDVCVVCGCVVGLKQDKLKARLCQRHKDPLGPATVKCFACKKIIHLRNAPPAMKPNPGYVCQVCWGAHNRCVALCT